MKRVAIPCLCLLVALLLTFTACGGRTQSYAYYEFYCEGDMRISCGDASALTPMDEEDMQTLLGLWGHAWKAENVRCTFDCSFRWDHTTIRYDSAQSLFVLDGTGMVMKLSREEKETVETILDKYR